MKTIIAPLVGAVYVIVELTLHIKVDESVQVQTVNAVTALAAVGAILYGIFKDHFKKKN